MTSRSFYNEVLTEHNIRPEFKRDLPNADIVLEGVNPSCGDDIWLKLKLDGDVIARARQPKRKLTLWKRRRR